MAKLSIDLKEGKLKKESDVIIGIDLGTTNSLVAYIRDGEAIAVKDEQGKSTLMPSIIHFQQDNKVVVGEIAKQKLISDPSNTIYSVKRLMGKAFNDLSGHENYFGYKIIDDDTESLVKIRVRDSFFSPIELSAEILKGLKERVEKVLGETVTKAVITVPAYFNDTQRQATRDAGKLAGLDVLRIVNEPTAASLAYGIGRENDDQKIIAVYDLGGGTFDISILSIHDGIFEVLSTNGDTYLGGDDFDRKLIDFWLEQTGIQRSELIQQKELSQAIRLLAEEAKKILSTEDSYTGKLNGYQVSITKSQFEKLISPLVDKTLDCCKTALKDAAVNVAHIDHVVMVGGSTRVPLVKETVAAFFEQPVYDKLNPDEVVALGAAIQADVLAGNNKNILLLDVTPLSLGIETVGGLMDVIIPRNNKIPVRVGRNYTTSVDGQTNLKVAVFQGERDLVEHNRKLGEFILRGIPPMAAGMPKIEIQFLLDADGILRVKAKELRSGVEQEVEIRSQYGISEEEMAKMLIESIQNAEKDVAIRGLLEARNEANNIILSSDRFLSQNAIILEKEEIEETKRLTAILRKKVEETDKDAINLAIEELNAFTNPLAHRAMDMAIVTAMKGKKIE
ncbi:MAG: Fe-S protein assembly chaperone HscA [Saprospiraceae bacterium]|nr:Fe-S protein assembly chaperone HscA [Saprospiraceae bacterium]MCB9322364.1 Fe-S protein assembly chaperone HscA [Lewinellaceae bacterium]